MNNKHLACLVVGFLIIAMMQWTNVSHQKLKSAQDLEVMSRSAFDSAVITRVAEQRKMVILKNKTESKRNYLNEWSPYINQIKNAQVGEALINMKIKEAKIITLSQVFSTSCITCVVIKTVLSVPNDFINSRIVSLWLGSNPSVGSSKISIEG